MVRMAHLLTTVADSTSETWCDLANDASGERAVLYRSRIHVNLAQISNMCHFGSCSAPGAHGRESGEFWCVYPEKRGARTPKQPQGTHRTHIRRAHSHFALHVRYLHHLSRKFVFAHYFRTEG